MLEGALTTAYGETTVVRSGQTEKENKTGQILGCCYGHSCTPCSFFFNKKIFGVLVSVTVNYKVYFVPQGISTGVMYT